MSNNDTARRGALAIYARYAHLMSDLTGREADALTQQLASSYLDGLDLTNEYVNRRIAHILSRRSAS